MVFLKEGDMKIPKRGLMHIKDVEQRIAQGLPPCDPDPGIGMPNGFGSDVLTAAFWIGLCLLVVVVIPFLISITLG